MSTGFCYKDVVRFKNDYLATEVSRLGHIVQSHEELSPAFMYRCRMNRPREYQAVMEYGAKHRSMLDFCHQAKGEHYMVVDFRENPEYFGDPDQVQLLDVRRRIVGWFNADGLEKVR